jgi:gamma-glutamylcyclotransferase (GGCT)/AIG2-like uncharacterized protein YtfP
MKERIFAYGTLKVRDVQIALFGREVAGEPAQVKDWALFMSQEGYLFVKPSPDGVVRGMILELEPEEIEKADTWEDLNVYAREKCTAEDLHGSVRDVHIYTRRNASGRPYHGDGLYGKHLGDVLKDIRKLFG